jgi:hypothetical protein
MKKYLLILMAMVCFGITAVADGGKSCTVKLNGVELGSVTAWVDSEDGYLYVINNSSHYTVTVDVVYSTPANCESKGGSKWSKLVTVNNVEGAKKVKKVGDGYVVCEVKDAVCK